MKIKKVSEIAKTQFLNLYDCAYENKNGKEKHWFMASRKKYEEVKLQFSNNKKTAVDAVVVIATHEHTNEMVLIKQFRVPLNDYIYELPAGLIDAGESSKIAVTRELKEETGLTLVSIDELRSKERAYLSPGMTDESVALIYATCKGEVSTKYLEEDEDIIPLLISKEKARRLIESDEFIDIKALMALQDFIK